MREKKRNYITLDDPVVRLLAKKDPGLFLQRFPAPVLIDEIQYAPEILPYIKMAVDKSKKNGEYWLTGSQMFHSRHTRCQVRAKRQDDAIKALTNMKHVSETLAGRAGIVNLLALSNSEKEGFVSEPFTTDILKLNSKLKKRKIQGVNEVFENIYKGGMPGIYDKKPDLYTFFSSYISLYIGRDIKELTQVADEMAFFKFLTSVAARTGQMINYTELANDAGVSAPTAKQWVSLLVTSGIVYLLEPYFNNILKRAIKTPKLYFLDTGMAAYLLKWGNAAILERGAMSGAFFETYAVTEIIKSYYNEGRRPPIYYYRDKDQIEIDLILEYDGKLCPLEIKKTGTPSSDAIRHFSILEKTKVPLGTGGVISMYPELLPVDKENWYIPLSLV